jgi:single-strand DNA-binding protein
MASLNKVLLIGNLTRNPEITLTPRGTRVADLGLACNRVWKDAEGNKQEEVVFIDISLWGRLVDVAETHLQKGSPVFIEGRLHLDSWEQGGQKRSKLKVVGENLQLLARREGSEAVAAPTPTPTLHRRPAPEHPAVRAFVEPDLGNVDPF